MSTMFAEERKQQILELISKNQKIVVPELCNLFGVSPSTIRNDLRDLQDSNLITRTHGGAISNTKMSLEPSPSDKETKMLQQKAAIGRTAAELVDDNDIIAICTGTTTLEFAKCLLDKKGLTVVLNDIRIACFLEEHSDFILFILGGIVRKGFHYVNIDGAPMPPINIDKMFFSCNSLSAAMGATVPDFHLAANVASIMGIASETVLLCDSSKIGSVSFAQIASVGSIDTIVVDSGIESADLKELETHDAHNILIAPMSL